MTMQEARQQVLTQCIYIYNTPGGTHDMKTINQRFLSYLATSSRRWRCASGSSSRRRSSSYGACVGSRIRAGRRTSSTSRPPPLSLGGSLLRVVAAEEDGDRDDPHGSQGHAEHREPRRPQAGRGCCSATGGGESSRHRQRSARKYRLAWLIRSVQKTERAS